MTESFKYIENELKEEGISLNINDFASKAFYGFDIHSQNTTKTKINMYLAGDGFSEIKDRDSLLEMPRKYMNYFDYIVTNPPYGDNSPVLDASIINSRRLEINFIIQIVNMLKAGGKGLLVIPDGVLESPSITHFRDWLLKHCKIDKVVGLSKFAFAPYTKEKTYALYITKRLTPIMDLDIIRNEEIWFYIVDNDGFANSDKRFATNRKDENGKWLHDELSTWVDNDGIEHKSVLEQAWENKEQDEDEEYFNEWGNKIEGKKYGRVKLKEIFKNEFVFYPTVAKSEIKKIINQLPDIEDLIEEDLENMYIKKEGDKYFDLLKPKHKYLNLTNIKELFTDIKTKKDLLTEEGFLSTSFSIDSSIYGYEIKEGKSGFNINIWKKEEDTYKEISEKAVMSRYKAFLIESGEFINDLSELLDEEGNLREKFAEIFEELNIYYDIEEDKFYNHTQRMSRKLLYLIPEKYFREKEIATIDLETFKKENDSLIENIKSELNELLGGL